MRRWSGLHGTSRVGSTKFSLPAGRKALRCSQPRQPSMMPDRHTLRALNAVVRVSQSLNSPFQIFTVLREMQTRPSDKNSVRPSVYQTRGL